LTGKAEWHTKKEFKMVSDYLENTISVYGIKLNK